MTKSTTDHDIIRNWAEARGGHPARVRGTGDDGGGVLRLDFGEPEENLEPIDWDEFFAVFEDRELAFTYQDHTATGEESRFGKFVSRSSVA